MKAGIAQSGRTILAAITAALMVLSVMFVFADTADATHVDPEPVDDNANCSTLTGLVELTRFDPVPDGETSQDGVTIDVYSDGTVFDWSSTVDIEAVFVKGGAGGGGNLYIYDPAETSDTGLHALTNNKGQLAELSHITFCVPDPDTTTTTTSTTSTTSTTTTTTTTTTLPSTTTTTTAPTTTTTAPPEPGEIVVRKVVIGEASQTFAFTFNTTGFTLGDNTLAHGESSSSGDIAAGDGYSVSEDVPTGWTQVSATCDDGSPVTNIDVAAGETVTCTFTNTIEAEVEASIVVTVTGSCELDGDEGQGVIDVEISVDGGADVVISDSDGDVIETLSSSGTVIVPEGATYRWEATPNEGFEFPSGSDTSGSITIETCSEDPETLPFTGLDTGMMSLFASALLGGGLILVNAMRRREEA